MAHAKEHAISSSKKFGGIWEDYIEIHDWLDEPKYWIGENIHRMFRHHSEGIQEAENRFGREIVLCDGKKAYVKYICKEHIREDCDGYIPSAKEWLTHIRSGKKALWMMRTQKIEISKGKLELDEKRT